MRQRVMGRVTVNINLMICVINCGKIFLLPDDLVKRLKFKKVTHENHDLQGSTRTSSYLYINPFT
jgi:hypothetical protein